MGKMYRGKMNREKITYEVKLKRSVFARRKNHLRWGMEKSSAHDKS